MDFSQHNLIKYSFYWLMLLLLFSAGAMFLGARPPVTLIFGYSSSAVWSILDICWIVSGVAAAYLVYQWQQHNRQVFGGRETKDRIAFWFMIVVGLNMGVAGIFGPNLFLNMFENKVVYVVAGGVCLIQAYHLWNRWRKSGEVLFGHAATVTADTAEPMPSSRPTNPSNL